MKNKTRSKQLPPFSVNGSLTHMTGQSSKLSQYTQPPTMLLDLSKNNSAVTEPSYKQKLAVSKPME